MSDNQNDKKEVPSAEAQFNVDMDAEAELEEMRRQVDSLQEDMQLKTLQESAAKDEGQRKTAVTAANAATAAGAAAQAGVQKSNSSIFVGDLDTRTTEADLRVFFSACGTIVRVTVLKDRMGTPKGSGYVEFETEEQAHAALLKDGQSLHGKPLKVAMKRDNVPAYMRGAARGGGAPYMPRGVGRGAGNPMQQQMAALAMMAGMMSQGFNPYAGGRGAGGAGGDGRGGGRGRGRGRGNY